MKIQIQLRDLKLTKAQQATVERRLDLILASYGERIDRLKVSLAASEDGYSEVEIEVRMKARLVRAEHSDTNVLVALDHAAQRAARSVARAIAREGWWLDTDTEPSGSVPVPRKSRKRPTGPTRAGTRAVRPARAG
jgi:ribosomal subunit interface protein